MREAGRYKMKQLCLYSFLPISSYVVLCSIWRARRPTRVGEFEEITLDAAKACIAEQGEEENERTSK